MSNKVVFRKDENCEMLEVYIDGKIWRTGNFWDFNFESDVLDLLDKVGVSNSIEEYEYDDYCEEGEDE